MFDLLTFKFSHRLRYSQVLNKTVVIKRWSHWTKFVSFLLGSYLSAMDNLKNDHLYMQGMIVFDLELFADKRFY